MGDEYTKDDLYEDLQKLIDIGLIEIVGITEEGQWLYGPTQKSLDMTEEQRSDMIRRHFD